jgi:multiple sugar transport system permease protein
VARASARFNEPMTAGRVRSTALGYALLAPSLFGVVTFLLLPLLVVLWLSLYRWDLLGPIKFVGLRNCSRCSRTHRLPPRSW